VKNPGDKISRRTFLGRSISSLIGTGIGIGGAVHPARAVAQTTGEGEASPESGGKPRIKEYRKLGRTGYMVSDIAFGNAAIQDPSLLEYAIDRGVNYVDTARQYYDMEKVIGRIFPGKRDKLFVTTKLEPTLFTDDVTAQQVTTAIDESLERLSTDHIDCCLIHSIGEDPQKSDRTVIKNPGIYKAFTDARKAGKIRFWGASSHGPKMIEEFTWLMENTDIDMIMAGMNLMTRGLEPVLSKAKERNIAVVAMKSLSAARKIDFSMFKREGRTTRQALIKWMLSQKNIDTIVITMRTFEEVDEFVEASGKPEFSTGEKEILEEYTRVFDREYCRPGCGGCMAACPQRVPISDILRYGLYF